MEKSLFEKLYVVDVSGKIKAKNGLSYLSWASAVAELGKVCNDFTYEVVKQIMDNLGNTRFWHDDGKSAWVETEMTLNGVTRGMILAVMDHKNQPIAAENVTSVSAQKTMMRCLTKNIAMFGLGLFVYEGEDLPEDIKLATEKLAEIDKLLREKAKLGAESIEKCKAICLNAAKKFVENEGLPISEDEVTVDHWRTISDVDILNDMALRLKGVRVKK